MFKNFFKLIKHEPIARKYFFKIFSISVLCSLLGIYFGIERIKNNGDMEEILAQVEPSLRDDFMMSATVSYIGFALLVCILFSIYFTVKHLKK